MNSTTRKKYIDNLRWMILLVLIPYHAAMAWNVWGESNYIMFEGNRLISSIVVFFSPYFMPLLFVIAGISTKFALQKRTMKEYFIERLKRLLIPFAFGTIVLMPVMSYIADKINCSYNGGFFEHYKVFFTRFTDLSGADGGFTVGQFWFLLYLFVISVVSSGAISLLKKTNSQAPKTIPFWLILVLGLPLPLLNECLSIGGKSLMKYTYLFLLGYFVFTDEKTESQLEKNSPLMFGIGIAATILNVYLYIWSDEKFIVLNTITNCISEWIMVIALMGVAKKYLNFNGKISAYMGKRSFLFYTYHFIWVVLFQYLLYELMGDRPSIIYAGTVLLSYFATFACCEISIRVPFLCFATGTKYNPVKIREANDNQTEKCLYVSDLDGTLLRSDETISEYTRDVINRLTENGGLFSYATARSYVTAKKVTKGLDAQIPIIVYNGTFVIDNASEEILISNYFGNEIREVLTELFANEIYPIVYSFIDAVEYFSFITDKCNKGMWAFLDTRRGDRRWREVQNTEELVQGNIFYITCIDTKEKLEPFFEKYRDKYHLVFERDIYTKEQWLEIMPLGASKANATLQLKKLLNCNKIVSFGDGANDIDMFKISDEAYAVSNAVDELKQVATAVIESNDEDGVAKWLRCTKLVDNASRGM